MALTRIEELNKVLDPVVAAIAFEHMQRGQEAGIPCAITDTLRTRLEHAAYHAQGRKPLADVNHLRKMASLPVIGEEENKRIITWATISKHYFGIAYHLNPLRDGRISWNVEEDINRNGLSDYEELVRIGEGLGLNCGGRWRVRDWSHYEFTGGLTLIELQQGKRPAHIMPVPQYRESTEQEAI